MSAPKPPSIVIRFSRRELELVHEALDFAALPDNPTDQRTMLQLRRVVREALGIE